MGVVGFTGTLVAILRRSLASEPSMSSRDDQQVRSLIVFDQVVGHFQKRIDETMIGAVVFRPVSHPDGDFERRDKLLAAVGLFALSIDVFAASPPPMPVVANQ
jgi:hypothetical protein